MMTLKKLNIIKYLKFFLIILLAICLTSCSLIKSKQKTTNEYTNVIENFPGVEEVNPSVLALELAKNDNQDTVAWIQIDGVEVNDPVVQSTDNDYYLRRNAKGEEDHWGSYFADYYSVFSNKENLKQNTVIYGHSSISEDPNEEKFSKLFRYLDIRFLENNSIIYLTVGEDILTFEIFAVFFTINDFYYIDPSPNDRGFDEFLNEINLKNEYNYLGDPITSTDKLLTLSTCAQRYDTEKSGNHRLVVMARLVMNDDKTDKEKLYKSNPDPKRS